jgi:hypothetical protein
LFFLEKRTAKKFRKWNYKKSLEKITAKVLFIKKNSKSSFYKKEQKMMHFFLNI